jgi:hypothetical protein
VRLRPIQSPDLQRVLDEWRIAFCGSSGNGQQAIFSLNPSDVERVCRDKAWRGTCSESFSSIRHGTGNERGDLGADRALPFRSTSRLVPGAVCGWQTRDKHPRWRPVPMPVLWRHHAPDFSLMPHNTPTRGRQLHEEARVVYAAVGTYLDPCDSS